MSVESIALIPPERMPIDGPGKDVPSAPIGGNSSAAEPLDTPPRYVSVWIRTTADPTLPVFDGHVVERDGWLAVVAGMTGEFESTPAIQLRHPERGWLPIGSQLLEPRARFTMTPLDDNRFLIVGGVHGSVESGLEPLKSCEVINPFIAGSSAVEPIDEPLVDHTAHAMEGGRAVIIGGSSLRVFAGKANRWTHRVPLHQPRAGHASILIDDDTVLIIGGDEGGTIEVVTHITDDSTPQARIIGAQLPLPLVRCGAALLPDGRIWIVGGVDRQSGASTDETWFLDLNDETLVPGPRLLLERGIASPHLVNDHGRVLVLGGEWVAPGERGEVEGARLFVPVEEKLWSLASLPERVSRRMWYTGESGYPAAFGGYRFIDEIESARVGRPVGPEIVTTGIVLRVGGSLRLVD